VALRSPRVIGSGASAVMEAIATPTYGNMIFAGGAFDGFAFDAAIDTSVKRAGIRTVGGMRATYELSSNGVQAVSSRTGTADSMILMLGRSVHGGHRAEWRRSLPCRVQPPPDGPIRI
jgi:hypothetical protein